MAIEPFVYAFHKSWETRAKVPGWRKRGRLTGAPVNQKFCLKPQNKTNWTCILQSFDFFVYIYILFLSMLGSLISLFRPKKKESGLHFEYLFE